MVPRHELSYESAYSCLNADDDAERRLSGDLVVRGLSYHLPAAAGSRSLLHDVSMRWRAGAAAAILGPSGAGKTTLLHCLCGDVGGTTKGVVALGGEKLAPSARHVPTTLVPQEDTMPSALSPREILSYAALLRGAPAGRAEELLSTLGLLGCADTPVGDPLVGRRGCSGGERKRTSIGIELLAEPAVLLADEPTTGLDSTMADEVVALLVANAAAAGRVVVVSIHQPSWQLLERFTTVTMLADGRVAYHGGVGGLAPHFERRLGVVSPPRANPAEAFMRALGEEADRARICEASCFNC